MRVSSAAKVYGRSLERPIGNGMNTLKLISRVCVTFPLLFAATATFARDPIEVERTVVTLVAVDAEAVEGSNNPGVFLLQRRGNLHVPITVYLSIGGTAENGVDYARLPGQVTIPAGEEAVRIPVEAIADDQTESVETVVLRVEEPVCIAIWPPPPSCYVVGRPAEAVVYIRDRAAALAPQVKIVSPAPGTVFRAPAIVPIEVVARDPDGYVTRVEFFANADRIGVREIHFILAPPPGQPQRFDLVWSNVPPGEYSLKAVATDDRGLATTSAPVRIRVRSPLRVPVVRIETPDPCATEPTLATAVIDEGRFRLHREGGELMLPLTVRYHVGGSASNGVDYLSLSGEVTFGPGQRTVDLVVRPLPDALVEETESVVIGLVQPDCVTAADPGPGCYAVGHPSRAVVWIRDATRTNHPPYVRLVHPPNGGVYHAPLELRLLALAGDRDGHVTTVEFFVGDRSLGIVTNKLTILDPPAPDVAPGHDVVPTHGPVMPFSWMWSNVPPGDHVLTAVATDQLGAQTRSAPVHIRVLTEPEPPVIRIMATDPMAREGTTNVGRFRILSSKPVPAPLTVYYRVGGTASNGVDYLEIPGQATLPAGARSVAIEIVPQSDNLTEGVESVILHLTEAPAGGPSYRIGRPATAAVLILDRREDLPRQARLANGTLHLRLPCPPGMPYRIETSTNLLDWEILGSAISTETGVSIVEPDPQGTPARFYRLVPEFGPIDPNN